MSEPLRVPAWHHDAVIYQLHVKAWTRAIVRLRSRHRAFGRGTFEPFDPQNRRVLVFLRRVEQEIIFCVNNLARHNGRDFYWFRLMPPGGPHRLGAVAQVGV